MRRKLSFVGGILGTVFSAIGTILMFIAAITVVAAFGILSEAAGGAGTAVVIVSALISLVFLALIIIALIFDIKAIIASKDAETLKSKKRGVVTAIVFNFLCAAYFIYAFSVFNLLIALGLIAAAVLMIVELVQVKKVQDAPVVQTASVEPAKEEFVDFNEEA